MAAALVAAAILPGCAARAEGPPKFSEPFATLDAFAQKDQMGRGMNVLAGDAGWNDPGRAQFRLDYFKTIRDAGFSTVRVVTNAFDHMADDDAFTLDPKWLAYLDKVVATALANGLTVIVDEHDFMICSVDTVLCRNKINAFWSQIAVRYKDAPNRVLFEILNEPHGAITAAMWNAQIRDTLAIIRASNPMRNVVIGPVGWNALEELPSLDLPDDPHIIATFHYYHPFHFTHQGVTFGTPDLVQLHDIHWGTEADKAAVNAEFDTVKAWGAAHHRPIFMGEFGSNKAGPVADRAAWTSFVARAAEAHDFAWAYWHFGGDFEVFDLDSGRWVEPFRNALVPPKPAAAN
jgi:endoglucanase